MKTEILLNHYLQEEQGKLVSVTYYTIQGDTIVVFNSDGNRYNVPLIEYMTFIYNKLR